IRSHSQYVKLSSTERDLVEDIMDQAIQSDRKDYYFNKLTLLLDTPTNPSSETEAMNRKIIRESIEDSKRERRDIIKQGERGLEEYLSYEEFYENAVERKWRGYRPNFGGPFFYVADDDPLDILVHIKVRLHGNYEIISKIILLEDAIEKHLSLPGYSVNLVFVGYSEDEGDVFDVKVNPKKWVTSHNWAGGYKALGHELMHLMGLSDEYDRIESHAENKNMLRVDRLYQFKYQMEEQVLKDAANGIMCFYWLKPLDRHACASVGLGEECVQARLKDFETEE
ncbi:MAG: hypothetical protein KKD44_27940, partial [Proteobacteria bacterium]|nr:hypothetical protein [Pseudomonadota bacterium]